MNDKASMSGSTLRTVTPTRAVAFFLPLILAASYLNMGQSDCGTGGTGGGGGTGGTTPPLFGSPADHIVESTGTASPVQGQFQVTDDGVATYTIPLEVPIAPGGMQPQLALAYAHQSGDGPLGIGWSLAGLSTIHPCQPTLDYDGYLAPLQFDGSDPLCLDGQRLEVVSGSLSAGTAELRTDPDTFQKIEQVNEGEFVAYLPDGRIRRYIARIGTRVVFRDPPPPLPFEYWPDPETSLVRYAWALASEEDRFGRGYRVTYETYNITDVFGETIIMGSLEPQEIEYYNANGDLARKIEFEYENRPDPSLMFESGLKKPLEQRLRRIRMKAPILSGANPITYRTYELTYRFDTGIKRSELRRIEMCNQFGQCTQPVEFTWSELDYQFTTLPPFDNEQVDNLTGGLFGAVDIDHDGVDDVDYGLKTYSVVSLQFGGGAQLRQKRALGPFGENGAAAEFVESSWPLPCCAQYRAPLPLDQSDPLGPPLDLDNDGDETTDMWLRPPLKIPFVANVCVWPDGSKTATGNSRFTPADLNGDGLLDLVEGDEGCACWGGDPGFEGCDSEDPPAPIRVRMGSYSGGAHSFPELPIRVAGALWTDDFDFAAHDLDGDGRTEILYYDDGSTELGVSALDWHNGAPRVRQTNLEPRDPRLQTLADLNGDGLIDAIQHAPSYQSSDWHVRYNTGQGFTKPVSLGRLTSLTNSVRYQDEGNDPFDEGFRYTDINMDGRVDIVVFPDLTNINDPSAGLNGTAFAYISNGTSYEVVTGLSSLGADIVPKRHEPWFVVEGDFTGDGLNDFAHYNAHTGDYFIKRREGTKPGHITSIIEGDGTEIRVEYRDIVEGGYIPGTGCDYPQRCVKGGIWVVGRVELAGPDGVENSMLHSYADARFDNLSRQPIGFANHTIVDLGVGSCEVRKRRVDTGSKVDGLYRLSGAPAEAWKLTLVNHDLVSGTRSDVLVEQTVYTTELTDGARKQPQLKVEDVERRYFELNAASAQLSLGLCLAESLWDNDSHYDSQSERMSYTYDDFGHREWSYRVTDGVAGWESQFVQHMNDTRLWILDPPTQIRVNSVRSNSLAEKRFDITNRDEGVPWIIRTNAHSPADELLTNLTFDAVTGALEGVTQTAVESGDQRSLSIAYEPAGIFPTRAESSLGHLLRASFHAALGVPTELVDFDGRHWDVDYDGYGRVVRFGVRGLAETAMAHGHGLTVINDPRANLLVTYDHHGRPTSEILTLGSQPTRYRSFDYHPALGEVERWSNWRFSTEEELFNELELDGLGRVTMMTAPHGASATTSYDGFSSVTTTDMDGNTSIEHLNTLGQIVSVEVPEGAPQGLQSDYQYGAFGQITQVSDPEGTATTIVYDSVGRPETVLSANTGLTTLGYDPFGQLRSVIDVTGQTIMTYDDLGRIETVSGPDGLSEFRWRPGAEGLGLDSATSAEGVRTDLVHDVYGRPTTFTTTLPGGDSYATSFGYDAASRVERIDYPSAGAYGFGVLVEYDGFLPKKLTDALDGTVYWESLGYHPSFKRDRSALGNGLTEQRAYQTDSQYLTGVSVDSGTTPVFAESMAPFPSGLPGILSSTEVPARLLFYDGMNRLESERLGTADGRYDYTYYNGGTLFGVQRSVNDVTEWTEFILKQGQQASTHNYAVAGDPTVVTNYEYDDRGRRSRSGDLTIAYNAFDLPRQVETPTETLTFDHDVFGSRVAQTSDAGAKIVSIGELYRKQAVGGVDTRHEYRVRLGLAEVAQVTMLPNGTRSVQYLHHDLQDNVVMKTDETGAVVATRLFGPFGNVRLGDPSGEPGFSGHMHETYASLIHMRGRVYDPQTRSFLTPDPIVAYPYSVQGWHGYAYGLNNPFLYRDFSGFDTTQYGLSFGACVVFCGSTFLNLAFDDQGGWAINSTYSFGGFDVSASALLMRSTTTLSSVQDLEGYGAPQFGGQGGRIIFGVAHGKTIPPGDSLDTGSYTGVGLGIGLFPVAPSLTKPFGVNWLDSEFVDGLAGAIQPPPPFPSSGATMPGNGGGGLDSSTTTELAPPVVFPDIGPTQPYDDGLWE